LKKNQQGFVIVSSASKS